MHKGEFVMVFIAFFACFGLGVFIGLAGKILPNIHDLRRIVLLSWLKFICV